MDRYLNWSFDHNYHQEENCDYSKKFFECLENGRKYLSFPDTRVRALVRQASFCTVELLYDRTAARRTFLYDEYCFYRPVRRSRGSSGNRPSRDRELSVSPLRGIRALDILKPF